MGRLRRTLTGLCLAIVFVLVAHPANAAAVLVIDTPPQATVTVPYAHTFTASGGTAPYVFSVKPGPKIVPPGLSLASSGLLAGTPTTAGGFVFIVVVTDNGGLGATVEHELTMTVGVLPMTLGSTPPAQVTALVNFTHQFTAAFGMPPYKFHLASGSLPSGVILQESGLLVGAPHEVGVTTFQYNVNATDFLTGNTGSIPFTLVVVPPTITSPAPTSPIYTGQDFGHAFTTTPGTIGSREFMVSDGTLPPGLTLGVGGVLSGKPMAPDTYNFTVRATFVAGITITSEQIVTMVVADPKAAFTSAAPPNGVVGTPYAFNFTAGGDAGITFSVSDGTVPPGLSLTANGALTGTPSTAGTYAFVVAATGAGSAARLPTTITMAPAPASAPTQRPSPPNGLAPTGTTALWFATVGMVLVGAGAVLTLLVRRRRTATETLTTE